MYTIEANLEAIYLAKRGETEVAIGLFEADSTYAHDATSMSWYAVCLARIGGRFNRAMALGKAAVLKEFCNPEMYLNLGRVCLMAGDKRGAVAAFKEGLVFEPGSSTIRAEIRLLGIRRVPPISFLRRSNPVNRFIGQVTGN